MANKGRMEEEGMREALSDLYVDGQTRTQIGEALNCHKDTVSEWLKDERVRVLIDRKLKERARRFVSKIDTVLEKRLDDAKNLTTEELLKIRKEVSSKTDTTPGGVNVNILSEAAIEAFLTGGDPAQAARLKALNPGGEPEDPE